jgi:hypothetical protein
MKLDPLLLVALSIVAFVGLWCIICRLIAGMSGWGLLARAYECSSPPDGVRLRFQSAGMRRYFNSNYGGCLSIVVNEEGLGLSVFWPFRIGHPPLFIPWFQISIHQEKRLRVFTVVRFDFKDEPRVAMLITPGLMRKLNDAIGRTTLVETK